MPDAAVAQETRTKRHTLMLTDSESNDAKLVAALRGLDVGVLLREWSMKSIRAEAEEIRAKVVT